MPKLDDTRRQRIKESIRVHNEIKAAFDGKRWESHHCRYCNWASNGRTFDEAMAADSAHIHSEHHEEDERYRAYAISIQDIVDSLHDHDCDMVLCSCICGCQVGPYCRQVGGLLCSDCVSRDAYEEKRHGVKRAA